MRTVSSPHEVSSTFVGAPKKQSERSLFARVINRIKQVFCCSRTSTIKHNDREYSQKKKLAPTHLEIINNPALLQQITSDAKSSPDSAVRSGARLLIDRLNQYELKHETGIPLARESTEGTASQADLNKNKRSMTGRLLVDQFARMIDSNGRHIKKVEPEEIASILRDIECFENGVSDFKGPHFDARYLELHEMGTRAGMNLDSFQLNELQEGPRAKRKAILGYLNSLTNDLNEKVHKDGKPCETGCVTARPRTPATPRQGRHRR